MKNKILCFGVLAALITSCSNQLGTKARIAGPYAPGYTGSLVAATPENLIPTVTAVTPEKGGIIGGSKLTITGTNFVTGATIKLGSQACLDPVVVSSTKMTCITPSTTTPRWVKVEVIDPDLQTGILADSFQYILSNAHPSFGEASGGGRATSAALNLRGVAGGMASQPQPSGGPVRLYPGLTNVAKPH